MYKVRIALILMAAFSAQQGFAAMDILGDSDGKPCATVAKACLSAGFTRTETASKKFWQDCMKPILLGQTVEGVTIDPTVIQTCRTDKVAELKKELEDIQNSMSKAN